MLVAGLIVLTLAAYRLGVSVPEDRPSEGIPMVALILVGWWLVVAA